MKVQRIIRGKREENSRFIFSKDNNNQYRKINSKLVHAQLEKIKEEIVLW